MLLAPIVFDTRHAQGQLCCGIARGTVELVSGLARFFALHPDTKNQLLLVGGVEPPFWITRLVRTYPSFVRYWSGGGVEPAVQGHDWPESVIDAVELLVGQKFVWASIQNLATGTFPNRTLKRASQRCVNILYEGPELGRRSYGRFVERRRTKNYLSRTPLPICFSPKVSEAILHYLPSATIETLGVGVSDIFGSMPLPQSDSARELARKEFLRKVLGVPVDDPACRDAIRRLVARPWLLSFGRDPKQRFFENLSNSLAQHSPAPFLIRVIGEPADIRASVMRVGASPLGLVALSGNMMFVPCIPDSRLAELMNVSDLLIHATGNDGGGWPIIESLVSGLPVVTRSDAGALTCFDHTSLPGDLVATVDAQATVEQWVEAVRDSLSASAISEFRKHLLPNPKQWFLQNSRLLDSLNWDDVVNRFLHAVSRLSREGT